MAQAARFFELSWEDAAKWGHPQVGDIELTEGPPAMVKHLLEQERQRKNKTEYLRKIKDRQEQTRSAGVSADLTIEQAIGGKVDWDHFAEMAVRPGTKHDVKLVLSAAAWGVLPTPLWLSKHGWEVEVVCNTCGRTRDLRHAVVGCGGDEADEAQVWQQAFGEMTEADIKAMTIQSKYL